ncbi:MAG: leucine zipper domain-containing protein [Betaproteobacteria bacterium]
MNTHKNARLTYARRLEMVKDIVDQKLTPCAAAAAHGVSAGTTRKWLGRYLAAGESALADRSSRPHRSPRAMPAATALAIVELRRQRLTQARIAASLAVSCSSVSRVLARAGLSRLADLEPVNSLLKFSAWIGHPNGAESVDVGRNGRARNDSDARRRHYARELVHHADDGGVCAGR